MALSQEAILPGSWDLALPALGGHRTPPPAHKPGARSGLVPSSHGGQSSHADGTARARHYPTGLRQGPQSQLQGALRPPFSPNSNTGL